MSKVFRLSLAFVVGAIAGLICLSGCTTQALDRDYAVSVADAKDVCAVVEKLPTTLAGVAASVGLAKSVASAAPSAATAPSLPTPPAITVVAAPTSAPSAAPKASVTAPATPAPAASAAPSK